MARTSSAFDTGVTSESGAMIQSLCDYLTGLERENRMLRHKLRDVKEDQEPVSASAPVASECDDIIKRIIEFQERFLRENETLRRELRDEEDRRGGKRPSAVAARQARAKRDVARLRAAGLL